MDLDAFKHFDARVRVYEIGDLKLHAARPLDELRPVGATARRVHDDVWEAKSAEPLANGLDSLIKSRLRISESMEVS